MKRFILSLALAATSFLAQGAEFDVEIENPTRGLFFTPLLVAAHADSIVLFEIGEEASVNLQAMAEVGDITGLVTLLNAAGATISENPANGLLAPGDSTFTTLNTSNAVANTQLSVVAMLLPTNDGFLALNSVTIPTEPGIYTYNVNAYDAGTEANNELRGGDDARNQPGMPVPVQLENVLGTNGTGAADFVEGYIHIHRGNLGDTNLDGGPSDIVSTLHRWLNPVARVTITVR